MKKKLIIIILITCILFINLLGTTILQTTSHENAHKQIAKIYEHKNITIEYGFLRLTGKTISSGNRTNNEKDLHSLNEIYNYQLDGLIQTIYLSSYMICLTLIILKIERN